MNELNISLSMEIKVLNENAISIYGIKIEVWKGNVVVDFTKNKTLDILEQQRVKAHYVVKV